MSAPAAICKLSNPSRRLWAFVLLLLCGASVGHAQYFSKRFPIYDQSNGYISSIQIVGDTIYAMSSFLDTVYPYFPIGCFDKFDQNGNLISKTLVNIPHTTSIGVDFNNLIKTNDGGFAFGGVTQDTSQSQIALLLLKYDQYGSLQWYREIPDTNYTNLYCAAFIQDSFSNYYLTGGGTNIHSNNNDVYLAKTDSLGNSIYTLEYTHPNYLNSSDGLILNNKGHLIIGGYAITYNSTDLSTEKFYMALYEIDTNGNELNYVQGTDTNGPSASYILPVEDGGYLIASAYYCYKDPNTVRWVGSISKLDSNFHQVWTIDRGLCSQNTQFNALIKCPDGNYLAAGQSLEDDTSAYHIDGWLLKFSGSGQLIWSNQYRGVSSDGPNGDNNLFSTIAFMSDNSIVCAGQAMNLDETIPPIQQGWLLHLDTAGCLPDSLNCGTVSGIKNIPQPTGTVHAYPNPANDQIQFDVVLDQASAYTIYITDLLGQVVKEVFLPQQTTASIIDVRGWPAGLYVYRVSPEKGFGVSGKFVVNH